MTTRRSFFKSLVAAIALSPVVCHLAKEIESPFDPKEYTGEFVFRQAYLDANTEIEFHFHPNSVLTQQLLDNIAADLIRISNL